ncbi:serum amyloid P-component-like [Conger conger]|uniref:serum amyloid P-component-like n=1 Tax=Conger conger TaxID=82655 RepID=UPI002A59BE59|nr:serum amyloid P-component-like [Conger conger]
MWFALKIIFLIMVLYGAFSKTPTDLTGKVFTFPSQSNTGYATLTPDVEGPYSALTLCLRSFPEYGRINSHFSMATPSHDNAFLLYQPEKGRYQVHVNNKFYDFQGMPDNQKERNSVCLTWDSKTGLTQLWVNGKRSIRVKLYLEPIATATPIIILGQDQDNYGGGFDAKQCLVGEFTDVHMWNYVLNPCEIQTYMNRFAFTLGNVLNWKALNFKVKAEVLVEPNQSGGLVPPEVYENGLDDKLERHLSPHLRTLVGLVWPLPLCLSM